MTFDRMTTIFYAEPERGKASAQDLISIVHLFIFVYLMT